ncbi:MAG: hypothetical protein G01um101438_938 [Parcubacteria group bacterium Gr01-1014_38]|nr:MAG: hypothetical protein G01um101438_938 [Parcubacteria group bacterium Gr01-1014_38]
MFLLSIAGLLITFVIVPRVTQATTILPACQEKVVKPTSQEIIRRVRALPALQSDQFVRDQFSLTFDTCIRREGSEGEPGGDAIFPPFPAYRINPGRIFPHGARFWGGHIEVRRDGTVFSGELAVPSVLLRNVSKFSSDHFVSQLLHAYEDVTINIYSNVYEFTLRTQKEAELLKRNIYSDVSARFVYDPERHAVVLAEFYGLHLAPPVLAPSLIPSYSALLSQLSVPPPADPLVLARSSSNNGWIFKWSSERGRIWPDGHVTLSWEEMPDTVPEVGSFPSRTIVVGHIPRLETTRERTGELRSWWQAIWYEIGARVRSFFMPLFG